MRSCELLRACERFSNVRITVVGDLMLDTYYWGDATRISPEAPVMVVEVERDTTVPGGAANVANNLLALGASVRVVGVCGEDDAGDRLVASLKERGADTGGIIRVKDRPTTVKTRVVTKGQQVVRIDREVRDSINGLVEARIVEVLQEARRNGDATVISDYAKGLITRKIAEASLSDGSGVRTVNAKPKNGHLFVGADLVTVNQSEAETMCDTKFRDDDAVMECGSKLQERLNVGVLVITRGSKGMIAFGRGVDPIAVPAKQFEVYDVAGAGDTVVSTLTMALATGADLPTASHLSMRAAAVVVGKLGVATVSKAELCDSLSRDDV